MIGEPLLPWQRWLGIHMLELAPGGGYRFKIILVLVARQNGKSSFGRTFTLWRMFMDGARTVLGVAQALSLAREMWGLSLETIRGCPDLAAELGKTSNTNGDEWFRIAGGARYLIRASNREAGRGLSVDQLNIDELREWRNFDPWGALSKTTMARPNSVILCMSNAGDEQSVVLNQLRDAALAGRDDSIGIFEWSAPDGCELDDIDAWRQANPSMGYGFLGQSSIAAACATDPPEVFRTEVLCQKVDTLDAAIDPIAWAACADPAGSLDGHRDRLAACYDQAPDGQHAALAIAALLPDGRVRVEVARTWPTSAQARAELPSWLDRIKPAAFGWYPAGPAGELDALIRRHAIRINKHPGQREPTEIPEDGAISGLKVAAACQGFAGLVKARQIVHGDQSGLNAHVQYASKLPSGDGWRFTRKGVGETGHVDMAYAAAGAVQIALTMPPPRRGAIRIVG